MDTPEVSADVLSSRQSRTLSVWEDYLEKHLHKDNFKPQSKLQRFRKYGKEILHSRVVLLVVVILNCLDCILVLSELILDVYFIKKMIVTAENTMEQFNQLLKDRHPEQFAGYQVHDTHKFYNKILTTKLICDSNLTYLDLSKTTRSIRNAVISPSIDAGVHDPGLPVFKDSDDPHFLEEEAHSMEELVSHAFHKASITILGILVLFTLFRIFCHGLAFVKHKLEVFDGIVVIASFTLDVCYIEGLTNYPVESFVLILVIMIPWRIIRVLNSLIIAVKDNFHFLLKLMYKKNKYQRDKVKKLETITQQQQNMLDVLTDMCKMNGVTFQEMRDYLPDSTTKKQTSKPLSLGACFTRQVSFQDEQETRFNWESLSLLQDKLGVCMEQEEEDSELNNETAESETSLPFQQTNC
ncbi:uncharacterized protein LOC123537192 [Mercenaria mercenaria]|uniref:uncharacterized protein LOC123537192 n=1 Tax=Mercenaria mercenaria TaxID=6596 RepID=UPI00234F7FBE|nr:uncharacterized protein LOC123537192 [Mercenaria mercenaria]